MAITRVSRPATGIDASHLVLTAENMLRRALALVALAAILAAPALAQAQGIYPVYPMPVYRPYPVYVQTIPYVPTPSPFVQTTPYVQPTPFTVPWTATPRLPDAEPMDTPLHPVPRVLDPTTPDFVQAVPGAVRINPALCQSNPDLCEFVNWHEQGHQEIGPSEQAADCYAARNAPTQAVEAAIAYFHTHPYGGDVSHGNGAFRSTVIAQCYAARTTAASSPSAGADSASTTQSSSDRLQCRIDARKDNRACRDDCIESNDDRDDRKACFEGCTETLSEALNACNDL